MLITILRIKLHNHLIQIIKKNSKKNFKKNSKTNFVINRI